MVQPFDGQGVNYMRENMENNPWMSQMSQQHGGWHTGDQWGHGHDWNQNYGHMQHQQYGHWNMGHGGHGSHGTPMHHGYHQSYPWQSSQQHWRPTQQHWHPTQQHWQTHPMHHEWQPGHHQQWQQWNPGHPWM